MLGMWKELIFSIRLLFSQIEYNDRPHAVSLKQQAPPKPNTGNADVRDDSEDDVDIDAI